MTGLVLAVVIGVSVGIGLGHVAGRRARQGPSSAVEVLGRLDSRLDSQAAEMRRLADIARSEDGAVGQMAMQLGEARASLAALEVRDRERRASESDTLELVRRLDGVLAGGGSKGRAGENVLREQLSALPPDLLLTDLRINGKVVEFAMVLPDGRRLPIDSKWSGDMELQALEAATTPVDRDAAARALEGVVARRAREVASYLDPSLTAGLAVAAVPDAVYHILRKAHADALQRGVVIVPYTWALPLLLFLRSIVARYSHASDLQSCLWEMEGVFAAMEQVLENKHARALTMLQNGNDEIRAQMGKGRGSLARARSGVPVAPQSVDHIPQERSSLHVAR